MMDDSDAAVMRAACGDTPALMIGLTTYGRVTAEKLDEILEKERQELR